jgi:type IV pilus assembly protein PilF
MNALDIDEHSAGAHMGLARVFERELEFELAEEHFQKAIKYGGGTEAHFQYAAYLYNRGNFEGAMEQYDIVLKDNLYARRAQAFEYRAIVANRLGMTDEAILSYKKAIVLNPSMSSSFLGLASVYKDLEDYKNAYKAYNGFVKLVRAKIARHSAQTLWLGIQLADKQDDTDAYASLVLQLKSQYSGSKEYAQFLEWQNSL